MEIIEGNSSNFDKVVLKNKNKVLVDFNATWCGPCRMLGPVLEELSSKLDDVQIVSIDVDNNPELSSEYMVSSIPCLVLFDKGKEVSRNIGFIPEDEIIKFIGE